MCDNKCQKCGYSAPRNSEGWYNAPSNADDNETVARIVKEATDEQR